MSTCRVCGHAIYGDNHDCGPKGPTFDDTLRALYDTIAQARREGVLIGVKEMQELAASVVETTDVLDYSMDDSYASGVVASRRVLAKRIRALDPNAIAACKGGSGE